MGILGCVKWRQTGNCDSNGPREPSKDQYCECAHGKAMEKGCSGLSYKTCEEACGGKVYETSPTLYLIYPTWTFLLCSLHKVASNCIM